MVNKNFHDKKGASKKSLNMWKPVSIKTNEVISYNNPLSYRQSRVESTWCAQPFSPILLSDTRKHYCSNLTEWAFNRWSDSYIQFKIHNRKHLDNSICRKIVWNFVPFQIHKSIGSCLVITSFSKGGGSSKINRKETKHTNPYSIRKRRFKLQTLLQTSLWKMMLQMKKRAIKCAKLRERLLQTCLL